MPFDRRSIGPWLRLCRVKLLDVLNPFGQKRHWNGFSPVWLSLCAVKLLDVVNLFGQKRHLNGLSPVWLLLWTVNSIELLNSFWQDEHWNGFTPLWVRLCIVNSSDLLNVFWQKEHWNSFSPVWLLFFKNWWRNYIINQQKLGKGTPFGNYEKLVVVWWEWSKIIWYFSGIDDVIMSSTEIR